AGRRWDASSEELLHDRGTSAEVGRASLAATLGPVSSVNYNPADRARHCNKVSVPGAPSVPGALAPWRPCPWRPGAPVPGAPL
ncbi:MAG: hypothetical protein JWL59_1004, partial [Chthoniobacteraceae bacterium]|nr:hypothetical protein [Chthoniobacteraceae bacterium]